jgi:tripartite-type tricarboxylate transporter receptor subunit TctC
MNLFRIPSALLTGALMAAMTLPAAADAIAEFYSSKQISLIIGYGTGGGYDLYARLLARFIGDNIPGKPTIVAQKTRAPAAAERRTGSTRWPPRTGH